MPKRFAKDMRLWIYRYLVQRDGDICRLCGKPPKQPFTLDIDHKDNDKTNDDPNNLQLAHPICNKKKEIELGRTREKKVTEVSIEGSPATRIVKDTVDYSSGSPEMRVNSFCEIEYRRWLIQKIGFEGSIVKKDAINAGAEHVGCSPMTTARYTEKLTSEKGPLAIVTDFAGNTLLIFKEEITNVLSKLAKEKQKTYKKRGPKPGSKRKKKTVINTNEVNDGNKK